MESSMAVIFNVPNMIGYFRFGLFVAAWINIELPEKFLIFFMTSVLLDIVDGWAARKFNQISDLGAVLDVVVDIFGRGILWCHLGKYGYAVPAWEWFVFACNHFQAGGRQWKSQFQKAPILVKLVMDKNFKTPLGLLVMSGIFCLPVWLYCNAHNMWFVARNITFATSVTWTLIVGRLLGLYVEMWCASKHLSYLLAGNVRNTD